jgi:hypothetical protein
VATAKSAAGSEASCLTLAQGKQGAPAHLHHECAPLVADGDAARAHKADDVPVLQLPHQLHLCLEEFELNLIPIQLRLQVLDGHLEGLAATWRRVPRRM